MADDRVAEFGRDPGRLKLFIGAAPGVGKTYTMLREAVGLAQRGIDVVVGYVDAHDREETLNQLDGLEVVPPKLLRVGHREFYEVDLDAIVARRPAVVVIDELAHTNTPGSLHQKRYEDVEYLLDHGLSVLSAVNVHHLEGIHQEAERITGVKVREVIPDSFVKRADEVTVIDVTPETLRQRLLDGEVFPPEQVPQALEHFFRLENLAGLRQLALRAVAEDVDERLEQSYARRRIPGPVGAREVILVTMSHPPRAAMLLARGRRMAERLNAELYALTVSDTAEDLLSDRDRKSLEQLHALADQYGAQWILEPLNDRRLSSVILAVADRLNVTQIVIGQPARGRPLQSLWTRGPVHHLLRELTYADLRIVGWKAEPEGVVTHSRRVGESDDARPRLAGHLTIYVGSAPGVGKTVRMLQDAHDWREKGIDVVAGLIESHGREATRREIGALPQIPLKRMRFGDRTYEELDTEAIVRRHPQVVLVDELAHTNVPGSTREKRYQDIVFLLSQGIDVVTAVNIQHLESLHDKVEHITGVKVRERVPDWFMKLADQVKLIDVTPETLQQRLVDGKIYAREKIEDALANFFQTSNLAALRELALLEVADDVDLRLRRADDGSPERILVCVNHRPHSERLIRRGWRLADRLRGELWVLMVLGSPKLTAEEEKDLERIRELADQLDARFMTRPGSGPQVGQTIAATAQELGVTQLVVGQPVPAHGIRGRLQVNPIDYVLAHVDFVDLHVVAQARR
jgi:two-component system sensor histidine kinase KdpD